jgi:hypothetical protein
MNFELTFTWPDGKKVSAKKTFNTKSHRRGWGFAKRWLNNCEKICGRDEHGVRFERSRLIYNP